MTRDQLRKAIDSKFGKMSRFAELAGIERYDLQLFFAKKSYDAQELLKYEKLWEKTQVGFTENEINPKLRKKLKKAMDDVGGVIAFCDENPTFNKSTIFPIISGKRKRIGRVAKDLLEHFNLK